MKFYLFLLCITFLWLSQACNQRSRCPAYTDIETISVAEAGGTFNPTEAGAIQVKRSRKTGLVEGYGKSKNASAKSKQMRTEKGFRSDPLFFDDKSSAKERKRKRKKFLGLF